MTFEQFCNNVEGWAEVRGIYEHSTALAQALKAVSEVGELADAVIKNDKVALIDAIGDVAVCLVNVARLVESPFDHDYIFDDLPVMPDVTQQRCAGYIAKAVGEICYSVGCGSECEPVSDCLDASMYALVETAKISGLDFLECCESAWLEIAQRKGRMVAGGAFVKE